MKKITFIVTLMSITAFAQQEQPIGRISPKNEAKIQNKIETPVVQSEKKQTPPTGGIVVKSVEIKDGKSTVTSEKKVVIVNKKKKKKIVAKQ